MQTNAGKPNYKFLLIAVLVCLSWLPLAYFDSWFTNYFGIFKNLSFTDWQRMSFVRLILFFIIFLIIIPIILKKKFGDSYSDILGINFRKTNWLAGILFIILPLIIAYYYGNTISGLQKNTPNLAEFVANIQPPIIEEAMFRGIFFYLMYKGGFKNWVILLVGALLFGGIHMPFHGFQAAITGAMSIFLFLLPRIFSRNIIPGMFLHYYSNSGMMMPVFLANCVVFVLIMIKDKVNFKAIFSDYNNEGLTKI